MVGLLPAFFSMNDTLLSFFLRVKSTRTYRSWSLLSERPTTCPDLIRFGSNQLKLWRRLFFLSSCASAGFIYSIQPSSSSNTSLKPFLVFSVHRPSSMFSLGEYINSSAAHIQSLFWFGLHWTLPSTFAPFSLFLSILTPPKKTVFISSPWVSGS